MIIALEQKFRRQYEANEQPEAFFTIWRLVHLTLRHFLLNKLCDPDAMRRVLEWIPINERPSEEELTLAFDRNTRIVNSLEQHTMEQYASKLNKADERELFTKYSGRITGTSLEKTIRDRDTKLWEDYVNATTKARHHVAHGKIFSTREASGMSFQELTESLRRIWATIRIEYSGDRYFEHTMLGGPLPPFVKLSYDFSSRQLTISENPSLITPEYDEPT